MNTIYTIGYAHMSTKHLRAIAEKRSARIIDIRYIPHSRRPEWEREALFKEFGGSYVHLPEFGNVNVAEGGPIRLGAPDVGTRIIADHGWLEKHSIILLCQCADWHHCHRAIAAEYLHQALGAPVVHLGPEDADLPGMVKVVSLNPPYGSLIAIAAQFPELGKHYETRHWPTSHRGLLGIHQTKGLGTDEDGEKRREEDLAAMCNEEPFLTSLRAGYPHGWDEESGYFDPKVLERGAIIAMTEVTACIPTPAKLGARTVYHGQWAIPPAEPDRSFGGFGPDRYAWRLDNIRRLREPLYTRGYQQLWDFPLEEIEALLEAQS